MVKTLRKLFLKCGVYKITFKDDTFGYYKLRKFVTTDNKFAKDWLKIHPFARYGYFPAGTFDKYIKKVECIYTFEDVDYLNEELYEELKRYTKRYMEVIKENMVHSHYSDDVTAKDPIARAFNLWINDIPTQKFLDGWCTPMYGYTDIEVEDLGVVLERCWRDAFETCQVMWQRSIAEGLDHLE